MPISTKRCEKCWIKAPANVQLVDEGLCRTQRQWQATARCHSLRAPNPRVALFNVFIHPLESAGIRAPRANEESTLRGLGSTACCMPHAPLRPTYSSATGRVQPSPCSLVARTLSVRSALENAAANCVSVQLNHAALAPCLKTHGYRGRAALAAVDR